MSVGNCSTKGNVGTDGAIVGSLSAWVSIVGPTERLFGELGRLADESVFLFNSIPSFFFCNFRVVPNFLGKVSEVCVSWDELLASVVLPVP